MGLGHKDLNMKLNCFVANIYYFQVIGAEQDMSAEYFLPERTELRERKLFRKKEKKEERVHFCFTSIHPFQHY